MRFFILIAVALAGYLIYRLYLKKLLSQGKSGKIQIGLIAFGLLLIAMAAMLRAPAFFALIGAALTQVKRFAPLMIKYAPWLAKAVGIDLPGMGGSTLRSNSIILAMDPSTGAITGTVLTGEFNGMQLSELSDSQLKQLYSYCLENDTEAVRLLQTYIARERSTFQGGKQQNSSSSSADAELSLREACDILGVKSDANKQKITQAYRELMRHLHPDKGGSNYLASKVNAAKDLLLKRLG